MAVADCGNGSAGGTEAAPSVASARTNFVAPFSGQAKIVTKLWKTYNTMGKQKTILSY